MWLNCGAVWRVPTNFPDRLRKRTRKTAKSTATARLPHLNRAPAHLNRPPRPAADPATMTIAAGLLRRLPAAARRLPLRRPQACLVRPATTTTTYRRPAVAAAFSTGRRALADDPHENETFEEFTARYENEFEAVNDVFELQVRFFFPRPGSRGRR
jgi:hypothetical protein